MRGAPTARDHFDDALRAIARGADSRALDHLRDALAADPESGRAHATMAIVLVGLERPLGALAEARLALRYAPDHPDSHLADAMTRLLIDDREGSNRAIDEVLRLDPLSVNALDMRAVAAQTARDADALDAAARGLCAALPHRAKGFVHRSEAAAMRRDAATAEAEARRALAIDPGAAGAHAALGQAFYLQRRFEHAKRAALSTLALSPNAREGRRLLSDLRFGRLPVVGAPFRWLAHVEDTVSIDDPRVLKGLAIFLAMLVIGLDLMRYAGLGEAVAWAPTVTLVLGGACWGLMLLRKRELNRLSREARLRHDY